MGFGHPQLGIPHDLRKPIFRLDQCAGRLPDRELATLAHRQVVHLCEQARSMVCHDLLKNRPCNECLRGGQGHCTWEPCGNRLSNHTAGK